MQSDFNQLLDQFGQDLLRMKEGREVSILHFDIS